MQKIPTSKKLEPPASAFQSARTTQHHFVGTGFQEWWAFVTTATTTKKRAYWGGGDKVLQLSLLYLEF
jgi:hypothetical protein